MIFFPIEIETDEIDKKNKKEKLDNVSRKYIKWIIEEENDMINIEKVKISELSKKQLIVWGDDLNYILNAYVCQDEEGQAGLYDDWGFVDRYGDYKTEIISDFKNNINEKSCWTI